MGRDEVILLDTHAAIWLVTGNASLGPNGREVAAKALANRELLISAISFWEIALLITKGRLKALRSPAAQRATILDAGIQEIALTGDISVLSVQLEDLPADPADRFIVGTAIIHGAALMTADAALLRWP